MKSSVLTRIALLAATSTFLHLNTTAQTVAPFYAGNYNIRDLGSAPGVPGRYGGIAFKAGDAGKLLIGGDGNSSDAKLYEVRVTRGAGNHITGFSGTATVFAEANGTSGGIDGGLGYGPGDVLFFTSYPDNVLGQIQPGSTVVNKRIALSAFGPDSVGSLVFVPTGMPGAGRLKILDYAYGYWFDTTVSPDGTGTYNLGPFSAPIDLGLSLEGAFYVAAGNPQFANHSVLVCDFAGSKVVSFEVNANGDPIPPTARNFITGLSDPEGGTRDPLTGDFVFSSFDGEHLYVVGGFSPGAPTVTITAPTNNARFAGSIHPGSHRLATLRQREPGRILHQRHLRGHRSHRALLDQRGGVGRRHPHPHRGGHGQRLDRHLLHHGDRHERPHPASDGRSHLPRQ